jgi:hypothetical protein
MTEVRTAAKVGSFTTTWIPGKVLLLNERWYVIFSDNTSRNQDVILDVRRDMYDFYKQVFDEVD